MTKEPKLPKGMSGGDYSISESPPRWANVPSDETIKRFYEPVPEYTKMLEEVLGRDFFKNDHEAP